jgi:hypothetical protein
MVRVTDARMSGTSFGTVFVHAAPEGAVDGVRSDSCATATSSRSTPTPGVIEVAVSSDEMAFGAAPS